MSQRKSNLKEILKTALNVSNKLEALYNDQQSLIKGPIENNAYGDTEDPNDREFEIMLQEEKRQAMNLELNKLKRGIQETQLMMLLGNYITTLEADKHKLSTQVKCLCSENNWLRKSLTECQQLLQESEITLAKLREETQHIEFLSNCQFNTSSWSTNICNSYVKKVEEENTFSNKRDEQLTGRNSMGSFQQSTSSLEGSSTGYETPDEINELRQISLEYVRQGKPQLAIQLCQEAVQQLEQMTYQNTPNLAALLNILADIYREQREYEKAIHVLLQILEIREDVFGPSHPIVAATLNNLCVLYGKSEDYETAEPFCLRALEIRQEMLGPDHPDVAKQFHNLAVLCSHLGKYDQVEHYYKQALDIFERKYGPDDPNVIRIKNNLASCYLKQGKYKTARKMFKKSKKGESWNHLPVDTIQPRWPLQGQPNHHRSPMESASSNTFQGPERRMAATAELERDPTLQRNGPMILGAISSLHSLPESLHSFISNRSQRLKNSRAALTWGWVFGRHDGQS